MTTKTTRLLPFLRPPPLADRRLAARSAGAWGPLLGLLVACGDDAGQTTFGEGGTSSATLTSAGDDDAESTDDGAEQSSSGVADESSSSSDSNGGDDSTTTTGNDPDSSTSVGEETTTGTAEESSSSSDGGVEESSTGEPAIPCPAGDLGNMVPATISSSTQGQDNEFVGSCGGGGAPDIAFTFTAPEDGPYTFDTFGSALDTILYVIDGTCEGTELACNDDGLGSQSLVSTDLVAGQTVTVVVDGFSLFGDDFELAVRSGQITCPRDDLGSTVPQTYTDSNVIAIDEFFLPCGSDGSPDFAYLFTAPEDGDYTFDTIGSDIDTVLGVYDGICGGSSIACNNDMPGAFGPSGVVVPLAAGEQVTVVVEGYFGAVGNIALNVGQLGGTCPDGDLGGTVPVFDMGNTAASDNTVGGSCGGATGPDETFTFTAPDDAFYVMSTANSTFDTVLYVRDGACDGPELACNNDVGGATTSQLAVALSAGQDVVVAVDAMGPGGDYELTIDQYACPGPALVDPLPIVENGSTAGLPNLLAGTCGGGGAPETTFTFTAPADGVYSIDTNGSGFDTVLYVLDGGTCGGAQLGCDDDGGDIGAASALALGLTMGQTVTIVVDGYGANSGAFTLNIDQVVCNGGADEDLGMALPITDMGSTVGMNDDVSNPCGSDGGAPDVIYTWTAPAADLYQFDTIGSAFDTVLHVYNGAQACGMALACNDDGGGNLTSLVSLDLAAGQQVAIAVDGYGANSGNYTLNVSAP